MEQAAKPSSRHILSNNQPNTSVHPTTPATPTDETTRRAISLQGPTIEESASPNADASSNARHQHQSAEHQILGHGGAQQSSEEDDKNGNSHPRTGDSHIPRQRGITTFIRKIFGQRSNPKDSDLTDPSNFDQDAEPYKGGDDAEHKSQSASERKRVRAWSRRGSVNPIATSDEVLGIIDSQPETLAKEILKILKPIRDRLSLAQCQNLREHSSQAMDAARVKYTKAKEQLLVEQDRNQRFWQVPFPEAQSYREYLERMDELSKELGAMSEGLPVMQKMSSTAFETQQRLAALTKETQGTDVKSRLLEVQWFLERKDAFIAHERKIKEAVSERKRQGETSVRPGMDGQRCHTS
ncbi:hypothetical protein Q7P37_002897 [Cladosporium fusiforme]